jgi:YVTN family beta-propeller protein
MKKKNLFRSLLLSAAVASGALTFTSCNDNNDGPAGDYAENAVLVSNEGAFTKSNASVSYINRNTGRVENDIFKKANGSLVMGDVLQSVATHGDRAFLVLNNSQKVSIVDANTFKAEGEIAGLEMPRYFVALNDDKAYVTEYVTYNGNGRVAVVDLKTNTVTKTIEVGINPEKMALAGGKLYVINGGGNSVSVINTASDELETTITVKERPNSLVIDRNNVLWVISNGLKAPNADYTGYVEEGSTPGALTKINLSTNAVISTYPFSSSIATAGNLTTNGAKDKLFYVYNNKVYQQDINATSLNATPFIGRSADYNALGVDPATGVIYQGKSTGYTTDGWVVRYHNQSGTAIDSFRVGIAPNGFVFR